jgi:CheY-like chemotaxis protein
MAQSAKALEGLRVLVVEDNFLAAEVVRDALERNGCTVVGPVGRVVDAVRLVESEALDAAVLDINLNGDRCFAIADALRGRDVPFVFLSGYDDSTPVPKELKSTRWLGKPVAEDQLLAAVSDLVAR